MAEQFSLFDAPQPAARNRAPADIGPADASPEIATLGRSLPRGAYLGTSSWAFPGWAGIVYDRPGAESALSRRGLAAYSRHPVLRAVGIDRTFYAPIGARDFAAYAEQVPPGFRFLVKAPAAVTDAVIRSSAPPSKGWARRPARSSSSSRRSAAG